MGGLVNNVVYLVYYINHCYCSLIFCFNTYCLVMYFTSSIGRCMGNIYMRIFWKNKYTFKKRKEKKTKKYFENFLENVKLLRILKNRFFVTKIFEKF